ncbi:hypothetical protein [Intrasporangium sp. YIM S08009]|uniref:hypothetical protein n=1 Tax=Intrasporangium zincisolvens TaxID=3080018 RepID=UPI002B058EEF|nr:hypothetical protein [Intrasporangium sp. YIM S08009]
MGRAGHVAKQVSLGLLALALVVVVPSVVWHQVLVVGGWVTDPADAAPGLFVAGVLVGLTGLVVSGIDRHRRRTAGEAVPGRPSGGRVTAVVLLVVTAGVVAGVDWLFSYGSDAVVLEPASAGGCRVVVEERSFLMSGGGTVFVLPAGDLVARRVGRYTTDDGYLPVEAGSYSLTWSGESGYLEVSGSQVDPVWPGGHEIDCPGG